MEKKGKDFYCLRVPFWISHDALKKVRSTPVKMTDCKKKRKKKND